MKVQLYIDQRSPPPTRPKFFTLMHHHCSYFSSSCIRHSFCLPSIFDQILPVYIMIISYFRHIFGIPRAHNIRVRKNLCSIILLWIIPSMCVNDEPWPVEEAGGGVRAGQGSAAGRCPHWWSPPVASPPPPLLLVWKKKQWGPAVCSHWELFPPYNTLQQRFANSENFFF